MSDQTQTIINAISKEIGTLDGTVQGLADNLKRVEQSNERQHGEMFQQLRTCQKEPELKGLRKDVDKIKLNGANKNGIAQGVKMSTKIIWALVGPAVLAGVYGVVKLIIFMTQTPTGV